MKSWVIYVVAIIGFAIYGASTGVDRDESGAIIGEGTVDAFSVRPGDCFNDATTMGDEVSSVPGVPCKEPHDYEAFAVYDLAMDDYLDDESMANIAYDGCMERFSDFSGSDYETSALEITTMYPTSQSWQQDDREVVCAVYDMDNEKLVGSAKGLGL